jgi:tetratricopeptide (TPR) repeat protein
MVRLLLFVSLLLPTEWVWAQADNRTIIGSGNEFLVSGASAIRAGDYDNGIRLTQRGLDEFRPPPKDRAAALCNLCAAFTGAREAETALDYCNESLALNNRNWRTYSNRAAAYTLLGMYSEATYDLDAAAALNPNARAVIKLREIINELSLDPRVIMEDHQQ